MSPSEIRALARMVDRIDYYRLLRVEPDAPFLRVREAYREARRRFHPDAYLGGPEDVRSSVDRISKRIIEGYTILRDPVRRAAYDRGLVEGRLRYSPQAEESVQKAAEARSGNTPNGRRFFALATEEERNGDLAKAISYLKMALTFESDNESFRRKLERLQAQIQR
jgi:curved DNA-binding protein CbpA